MGKRLIHVGIREFREGMAQYLDSPIPVAITRHGRTVGYYVPTHGKMDEEELRALKRAVEHLATLLADHGINEDEVVSAFRARRVHG
ncbi:MAG: type II toxin-antitoxin system Phd/YefM family antitoxin [Chloroflexi bacterium]|nr:type II toxin-antitoxin system Phd/YefM family antitoxin [Chloroflexota bacterium]